MSEPIRILLVDDHALFRKGLAGLINRLEDMRVVGEARDGQEALERARELMPDLILMDVQMPGCDGIEATRRIKAEMPYVRVVMVTVSDHDQDLFEALKSGAQGYLLKDILPEELFEMLRGVFRGEAPISRLTAARLLAEFALLAQGDPRRSAPVEDLTEREREVLDLVAQGAMNKEIAARLCISENTVKNHLRNILAKLHLRNRTQAVGYALREGLIRQDPRAARPGGERLGGKY